MGNLGGIDAEPLGSGGSRSRPSSHSRRWPASGSCPKTKLDTGRRFEPHCPQQFLTGERLIVEGDALTGSLVMSSTLVSSSAVSFARSFIFTTNGLV
jgi:hypothetical protein